MYRRAYILSFDRDENRDYKKIHNKIINLPSVITWSHYVKSSYILIANTNSATQLNNEILKVLTNTRFLLIEINLRNRNGCLPSKAWDWLKIELAQIK